MLKQLFGVAIISDKIWFAFAFMTGITIISYLVGYFGLKMNAEYGTFALLGAIVVKLLFSMAFVLIYSVKVSANDVVFMLDFFSIYLLFSAFEIYSLLRNLRHQNLK